MNNYFKLPLKWIGITNIFNSNHLGIDFGWNNEETGPNPDIHSISDGIVIENSYNNSTGYMIIIQTDIDNNRFLHRYCHMKEKSNCQIGAKVKREEKIGVMGSTGLSTGNHLHFDLWKCPKNYVMNWNDRKKYSVNPLNYCFLFEDQTVNKASSNMVTRVVGQKIKKEKNNHVNQLQVIKPFLRARKTPNINNNNIIGYIDLGIYNYTDIKENDDYTFYQIDENIWIAKTEDIVLYDKEKNLKEYHCKKQGYYYIYLKENEIIYYT